MVHFRMLRSQVGWMKKWGKGRRMKNRGRRWWMKNRGRGVLVEEVVGGGGCRSVCVCGKGVEEVGWGIGQRGGVGVVKEVGGRQKKWGFCKNKEKNNYHK